MSNALLLLVSLTSHWTVMSTQRWRCYSCFGCMMWKALRNFNGNVVWPSFRPQQCRVKCSQWPHSLYRNMSHFARQTLYVCVCVCSWAPSTPTLVDAEIPVLVTPAALLLSWLAGWVASEAHVSPSLPHTRPFFNVCVCMCVCAWRAGRRLNAAASVLAFGRKNAFNSCSLATVAQPRC